jgi:hypothetical protein
VAAGGGGIVTLGLFDAAFVGGLVGNDPNFANVSLLLHMDGSNGSTTFTDSSPYALTVTASGNAQISTAQSRFGGASIAFDGSGDYLTTPNNNSLKLGSGNFTIEYWFYPANLSGIKQHLNTDVTVSGNATQASYAIITSGTAVMYYLSSSGTGWDIATGVSVGTATLNTWQHVALVRNGNTITPYLNGVAGTTTTTSASLFNFSSALTIGWQAGGSTAQQYSGYIDELRITKDVARYTANFAPPTAPFPDGPAYDVSAQTYITAVETADGQVLETGVRDAINAFVLGCKADGIWNAIKASCILAGARTLNGALTPLVGTAPTNFNFVAGDYDRKTGLVGNGTSKYLNSNRNSNADPQNSYHMVVHVTTAHAPAAFHAFLGEGTATTGASHLSQDGFRSRSSASHPFTSTNAGFIGASRSAASSTAYRHGGTFGTSTIASEAPTSQSMFVYARNVSGAANSHTNARLSFYSIGESLDLALLDARVTALMSAISTSIASDEAAAYIAAVEAADGQPLEQGVRDAITTFIVGCAQDGIWNAIKASCILAGARTLNGALTPLVGTAPTNFNFVAGDYDRKTGLVGNGSTKYLDSNRLRTADPQNSHHVAVYLSTLHTLGTAAFYAGSGREVDGGPTGFTHLGRLSTGNHYIRHSCTTFNDLGGSSVGFFGSSRASSSSYTARQGGSNTTVTQASETLPNTTFKIFAGRLQSGNPNAPANARLAFYSIGESLDLALLDARVTTLMNALAVAIP